MEEPYLRLFVSDEMFRAIGHAVAQWAFLEINQDALMYRLRTLPTSASKRRAPQAYVRRCNHIMEIAKELLGTSNTEYTELRKLIQSAKSLRGKRDYIAHGLWRVRKRRGVLVNAVETFKSEAGKSILRFESTQQVETLARKISIINVELIVWTDRNLRGP